MRLAFKIEEYIVKAEKALVVALIFAMVGLSFMQVLLRIFFHSGIVWLDPLLRHMVLWAGLTGAALAALKRGYEVELLNFSTGALHQPPTRNAAAIYATLSTIQRRSTLLPPASRLVSSSARPRDFVLVTDSAIGNLEWTLPAYRKATRTHPGNRALLYLLGDGVLCSQCHYSRDEICYSCSRSSRETLVALQKAGFVPHHVERPSALEQLMARGLRRLVP